MDAATKRAIRELAESIDETLEILQCLGLKPSPDADGGRTHKHIELADILRIRREFVQDIKARHKDSVVSRIINSIT